jgi:outer membrane immunogenic protein
MKKFLLATVSMVALTTVTRAADMAGKAQIFAPTPMVNWSGGYFGIQGGVAQSHVQFGDLDGFFPASMPFDQNKSGGTFSGLAGYNWQQGIFVYGVEGDWSWVGTKTSRVTPDINGAGSGEDLSTSYAVNWLATLRGRVGFTFDSTLLYVTGGAAFGHLKNSVAETSNGGGFSASFVQNQTKIGWTAGVGVEHMFTQHWTARAEFRYADLGKTNVTCNSATNLGGCVSLGPSGAYRGEFSNRLMLGLVGVAYKF